MSLLSVDLRLDPRKAYMEQVVQWSRANKTTDSDVVVAKHASANCALFCFIA